MFNIAFPDLEKKLSKEQEGSVVIGRMKIRSIVYADDAVALATSTQGLKGKYIKMKRLETNVNR